MIDLFNQYQTILIGIGVMISNVVSFFAGRRQRRINNFQKQQQIFDKQIEQLDELVERQKKDDRTKSDK